MTKGQGGALTRRATLAGAVAGFGAVAFVNSAKAQGASCLLATSMRWPCSRRGMRRWYNNSLPTSESSFSICGVRHG